MFKGVSKFQIVFMGIFVALTVGGLLFFSLYKGGSNNNQAIITIWGTADGAAMNGFTQQVTRESGDKFRIFYVQKQEDEFDEALLEALATGQGPDAILVAQDSVLKQANKILPIPYKTLPEADFKDTFIEEGELFLAPNGILAIPFSIDPMVMYWNRDIFTNAAMSLPPKYWDEFYSLAPLLTKKDLAGNITQSAVALGEFQNITHAKDIVSLLMMQAGNPLVIKSESGYESTLSSTLNKPIAPANSALTFYTQFADIRKDFYSWNRGLRPDSQFLFQSNKVGVYFGYASEYKELKEKNPNLNFSVTYIPQARSQEGSQYVATTFGKLYGFSILKTSKNAKATYEALTALTNQKSLAAWSKQIGLPAVRRDALTYAPEDAASAVFATSAVWARGWLDPDDTATDAIYRDMIEGITSGRSQYGEAIIDAEQEIRSLLETINNKNR